MPIYQSKPDLPRAITFSVNAVLDFDGFLPGFDWSAVWSRIAAIFAPWPINVTSRDYRPPLFNESILRVFVDWTRAYKSIPPGDDPSGAAKSGDYFTQSDFVTKPAFVWVEEIPSGMRHRNCIADVIAHEAAHLLGCDHEFGSTSLVMNPNLIVRSDSVIPVFGELNRLVLNTRLR